MPWNIILIFMFLGFFLGINSAKKDLKKRKDGYSDTQAQNSDDM